MKDSNYLLSKGTFLNSGRYEILKHLGSGGFGNTYLVNRNSDGVDGVNGIVYAMKELFISGINEREPDAKTVSVSNDENLDTFKRQKEKFKIEAERLQAVHNPHIVKVIDFFEENGTSYYVMEFINGKSLDERQKPLHEEEVWKILDQVLDALSAIHQVKTLDDGKERIWVHLDIKPANLMMDDKGHVTLIDFGASKQLPANNSYSSISLSQMIFSRNYAPFEQISQNTDSIGPWTDFYALGATLYELQTSIGTHIPRHSELQDKVNEGIDLAEAFLFPQTMSEKMCDLIVWMMNPNRKKRPQSVSEIQSFLKPDPIPDCMTEFPESKHVLSVKTEGAEYGRNKEEPKGRIRRSLNDVIGVFALSSVFIIAILIFSISRCQSSFTAPADVVYEPELDSIQDLIELDLDFFIDEYTGKGSYYNFSEGLAAVRKNGLWGYIDKEGDTVVEFIYDDADDFSEGLAAVRKNGHWGYINKEGDKVVEFIYDEADDFSDGLGRVKRGDLYGFVDKKGKEVIPTVYDYADDFKNGVTRVSTPTVHGFFFLDRNGQEISDKYTDIDKLSEGLAFAKKVIKNSSGKWVHKCGYVDKYGHDVIPFEFSNVASGTPFKGGFAAIQDEENGFCIIINKKGEKIFEVPYQYGMHLGLHDDMYSDGLLRVPAAEWKCGFIDTTGEEVLPPIYYSIVSPHFSEGLAAIKEGPGENAKWGYINKKGEQIVQFKYDWATDFFDGFAIVTKDKKDGCINKNGHEVIPCEYDRLGFFSKEGIACATKGDKEGYIDKNGEKVTGFIYDWTGSFSEGLAFVKRDERWYIIDKRCKELHKGWSKK